MTATTLPVRDLVFRLATLSAVGAAALLAVSSLDAEIEDLSALFGAAQVAGVDPRLAAAAAACGELGSERESCEMSLLRLAPRHPTPADRSLFAEAHSGE